MPVTQAEPVHIIAEAGTTHEGVPETAIRLVDAAKDAGANSIKFQMIDPPGLYLTRLRTEAGLEDNPAIAARAAQSLSEDDWRRIAAHAEDAGLPFSASVFDGGMLSFLDSLAPPYIKIASTDLTNHPLIEAAVQTGRKVILSTGMGSMGEIEAAVMALEKAGAEDVVLLHCVSAYPCPVEISNVGFIAVLQAAFGLPVGFSDHTESAEAAIAAVALGARWIEKHMTLDRGAKGFDHAYAMEPDMLAGFIRQVRAAEAALARPLEKVGQAERSVMGRARRGLWAAHDLNTGDVLTTANILAVRPEGPLTPADLPRVLGRRLARPVGESAAIRLEDLE